MKIIFLDIDGVLNSVKYDNERSDGEGNIDISRLSLLKQLADKTDALIVLTSSWRKHWDPSGILTDEVGKELERTFCDSGVFLFDKTPVLGGHRSFEISAWLEAHPEIESFVILDDIKFGWGELDRYVVKTDQRIGRGLEIRHVDKAREILEHKGYLDN